ncbi:DUF2721 domain-containing protein [Thauera butanivorans]|uniref:DUF2721 domain-containing protein n=1 Tax=Thauera butanivorans TaxID=86174 RepID=UPI003AB892F1
MSLPVDAASVTHSVQLAVTPVSFLTAVAGMIGAVAGRLARIIDRARVLDERVRTSADQELTKRLLVELTILRKGAYRELFHRLSGAVRLLHRHHHRAPAPWAGMGNTVATGGNGVLPDGRAVLPGGARLFS